ncbi:MAG: tetratricopeptide repeat protein [Salibacteraceae bacterium]
MEEFSDNFFRDSDITKLVTRFEKMIQNGTSLYYEVDDLEYLLDHYIVHHRIEYAFKVIETAHEQHPQNRQLLIKEAELLSMADKYTEALALLSEVEILEGFNPEFHITRASIFSQMGSYNNAIKSLEQALGCSSDDLDIIYMNLAIEYQNLEQYEQAISYLNQALEVNVDNEDVLYELAYCFELTKNYEDAVIAFNKVIDQAPYNEHAWFNLGAAYQATGQLEKALTAFDYVSVIDENFYAAYFNKANVLVKLQRYDQAIELFKKALDFDVLDSLIYFYIGDCYDNLGDSKNALINFEKAIKKDDEMSEAWIGASNALDELNRELEALEYAKTAIKIEPDNGDFYCFLAGLQMKYDLLLESVESFEKAIELGYIHEDLWEDYCQLAFSIKNFLLSGDILKRGLEAYPENNLLHLYQCIYLYTIGEDEEAFEKLVEVLIKEPELIEEFVNYYPKGIERKNIQFLIESINQNL